jgi:transcriptional regulator with XRE-family HTH domain
MNQNLQALLDQLSPEERQGAILKVRVPKDTPIRTRTPQALRDEVRQVIAARAVGEALAKARKQAGLKAKDVAAALEVSAPRVAQVESFEANMTLSTLLEHAQAVGCEVEIVLRPLDPKLPLVRASKLQQGSRSTQGTRSRSYPMPSRSSHVGTGRVVSKNAAMMPVAKPAAKAAAKPAYKAAAKPGVKAAYRPSVKAAVKPTGKKSK